MPHPAATIFHFRGAIRCRGNRSRRTLGFAHIRYKFIDRGEFISPGMIRSTCVVRKTQKTLTIAGGSRALRSW
jgi:hypothetical protein